MKKTKYTKIKLFALIVIVISVVLIPTPLQVSAAEKPTVTIVGDSVPLGAAKYMKSYITAGQVIKNDCRGSRQLKRDGLPLLKTIESQGKLGDIVVLAMVTNSNFSVADAEAAIAICGPNRYVIFVTGYNNGMKYVDTSNAAIKSVAASHSNVTVCDWHKFILSRSNKHMSADNCHLAAKSAQWYARLIAEGVLLTAEKMGVA
jgi:hypothetical protein